MAKKATQYTTLDKPLTKRKGMSIVAQSLGEILAHTVFKVEGDEIKDGDNVYLKLSGEPGYVIARYGSNPAAAIRVGDDEPEPAKEPEPVKEPGPAQEEPEPVEVQEKKKK